MMLFDCDAVNLLFKYQTNQIMFNYRYDAIRRWRNANDDNFSIHRIINESEFGKMNLLNSSIECERDHYYHYHYHFH